MGGATVELSLLSRVGCCGPNGAGKSTLAGLVVGELAPDSGTAWRHPNLRVAFVAQHTFHHLERRLDLTATEYILWRFQGDEDREAAEFRAEEDECPEPKSYRFNEGVLEQCSEGDPRAVQPYSILDRRQRGRLGHEYEVDWRDERGPVCTAWVPRSQLEKMGSVGMAKREDERQAAQRALVCRPLTTPSVERHLRGFGLDAEEASHRRLGALSHGQRARVVLGAATWLSPHLLVLDEPSNYLDRPALSALAAGLQGFSGGLLVISHNEALVDEVCSERWEVHDGVITLSGKRPPAPQTEGPAFTTGGGLEALAAMAKEAREKKKQKRLKEIRRKRGEQVSDDDEWYEDLLKKANAK